MYKMYYPQRDWVLLGFKRSTAKNKKYSALIQHKKNDRIRTINFGSTSHEQFKDSTGLGLYSHLNHGDRERQKNYQSRHSVFIRKGYYSPGYFSLRYLWT